MGVAHQGGVGALALIKAAAERDVGEPELAQPWTGLPDAQVSRE